MTSSKMADEIARYLAALRMLRHNVGFVYTLYRVLTWSDTLCNDQVGIAHTWGGIGGLHDVIKYYGTVGSLYNVNNDGVMLYK